MNDIAGMTTQLSGKTVAYPNCIPDLTGPQVNQLREEYSRRINRVAKVEYKRVIDKHPLNFIYVGLIIMLFPGAKVIHTIRNPLDTCLSCFFQNFTNGQSYIFDLNTLAHFYNDYKRLMSHWNQIFDGRILNVEYEGLLADQRNETDRVLEYCGLDFEEGCLRFYETERTVKTASFKQVRKPIHQESKHRWKNYIPHLQNLAEMIGESIPNSQPLR
jgi:hypothetical protein